MKVDITRQEYSGGTCSWKDWWSKTCFLDSRAGFLQGWCGGEAARLSLVHYYIDDARGGHPLLDCAPRDLKF